MATIERLKKRPDFLAAAAGRRFHTDRMTAQGRLRETGAGGLRLGFTVTKRVGHATERNRIKRRLRAVVAEVAAGLPPIWRPAPPTSFSSPVAPLSMRPSRRSPMISAKLFPQ